MFLNIIGTRRYITFAFFVFILVEITQFQANGTLKRFTHENGRLIVTRSGYYYIYAQAFFQNYTAANFFHNRVALTLNGYDVSLMQTALSGGFSDFGSKFTGAIKFLNEGDYIGLRTVYPCALWVTGRHTFFGAYRIWVYKRIVLGNIWDTTVVRESQGSDLPWKKNNEGKKINSKRKIWEAY